MQSWILIDLWNNGGCGVIGGFSLVLDVVMVVGQFSGGSVLFYKSVLSSSGSMSCFICSGSGSRDFNKRWWSGL